MAKSTSDLRNEQLNSHCIGHIRIRNNGHELIQKTQIQLEAVKARFRDWARIARNTIRKSHTRARLERALPERLIRADFDQPSVPNVLDGFSVCLFLRQQVAHAVVPLHEHETGLLKGGEGRQGKSLLFTIGDGSEERRTEALNDITVPVVCLQCSSSKEREQSAEWDQEADQELFSSPTTRFCSGASVPLVGDSCRPVR